MSIITTCLLLMTLTKVTPTNPTLCQQIDKEVFLNRAEVLLMISIESSFRPEVRSHAGAVGLMQITPIALKEIQRQVLLHWKSPDVSEREIKFLAECVPVLRYKFTDLKQVRPNLVTGSCFFEHLLRFYQDDLWKALAHYNGGGVQVNKLVSLRKLHKETANYLVLFERLRKELQ